LWVYADSAAFDAGLNGLFFLTVAVVVLIKTGHGNGRWKLDSGLDGNITAGPRKAREWFTIGHVIVFGGQNDEVPLEILPHVTDQIKARSRHKLRRAERGSSYPDRH
jgi:hypothetical protein